MIDEWLRKVERLRLDDAVVVLKWDGERTADFYNVVISRAETDFIFRRDSDYLNKMLNEGIDAYNSADPNPGQ